MKANEAPEKIYIHIRANKELGTTWHGKKITNSDIEYTRTDAFIDKACDFIREHHHEFSFWNTEEYELGFSTQKFIEDFKKHMEQ